MLRGPRTGRARRRDADCRPCVRVRACVRGAAALVRFFRGPVHGGAHNRYVVREMMFVCLFVCLLCTAAAQDVTNPVIFVVLLNSFYNNDKSKEKHPLFARLLVGLFNLGLKIN